MLFQQTTDLVEKLRAQKVAFEELIIPDEIHELLRWTDWVRSYRPTAEYYERKLAAFGEHRCARYCRRSRINRVIFNGRGFRNHKI